VVLFPYWITVADFVYFMMEINHRTRVLLLCENDQEIEVFLTKIARVYETRDPNTFKQIKSLHKHAW